MKNLPFYTVTFAVPLFFFLLLKDVTGTIYQPAQAAQLGYQVVEVEEELDEEPVDEEPLDEGTMDSDPVDEADAEDALTDDAPTLAKAPSADEVTAPEAEGEEVAEASPAMSEDSPKDDADTEEVLDLAAVEPSASDLQTPIVVLNEAESAAAQKALRACTSCHQLEKERNGAGPHLVGVVGRPVGAVEGFRYSKALQELNASGAAWDVESLISWLENPTQFAKGTKMNFKVRDAKDRRLIATWLASNP